jgi:hypothetical protein
MVSMFPDCVEVVEAQLGLFFIAFYLQSSKLLVRETTSGYLLWNVRHRCLFLYAAT